ATRILSGKPARINNALATYTLTHTATDAASATASQTVTITVRTFLLDVDEDGKITASDGIMIARYLLGVRGASLVDGQSDPANLAIVTENLEFGEEVLLLDANDDGEINGKDGILIARYLLGLRGDALLEGLADDKEKAREKVRELQTGE
ncbi:MAG: dockerin type I domain-containing protein, partial [Gammaproteobacteria bacterium]